MRATAKQRGRGSGGITQRGFKPGQSGNPGGRTPVIAEIRDLARAQTAAAVATLVQIMRRGKTDAARVSAASALLDRAWGRPAQGVEHSGWIDSTVHMAREAEALRKLSPAERAELRGLLDKAGLVE